MHYLDRLLNANSLKRVDLYSCGIAEFDYKNESKLLTDVQQMLYNRGLDVSIIRNKWSMSAAGIIDKSELVLVADHEVKEELLKKIKFAMNKIYLFYEFIGEGNKGFNDTFDYSRNKQNRLQFQKSFNELERIANLAARIILQINGKEE